MNCYIVASETSRKAAVIDPGGSIDMIIATLKNHDLTAEKIINTHGHIDHVAGVKELQEHLHIPFFMHEADEWLLQSIPDKSSEYGLTTRGIPQLDGYLHDGDSIEIDDLRLTVLHTPGHSPGGVCFLAEDEILVGDTLFAGSVGRTDLPGGDHDKLLQSVETKLLTLDDSLKAYCGHGPSTTIGFERYNNPFLTSLRGTSL